VSYALSSSPASLPSILAITLSVSRPSPMRSFSKTRPADPGAGATGDYELVSGSDDYRKYKDVFAQTASKLIASGRCTAQDFKEMGAG
jgi:hypothetical protein